jgi:hypothetical protein
MKFKALIFTGLFAVLAITHQSAFAQDKQDKVAKAMTDSMQVKLALNDDQYKKSYDINSAFVTAAKDIKNSEGGKMQKLKQLKAAADDRDSKLKGVLTPDQFKKYEVFEEERKQKFIEKMKEHQDGN